MISPPSSTSTRPLPARHCTVEFQALASRIGVVRRILTAQLRYWRLDPLIDAATLGAGELLANVHQHARPGPAHCADRHGAGDGRHRTGPGGHPDERPDEHPDKHCTVELSLDDHRLTIAVHDHDPRLPSARPAPRGRTATHGRGLALVASVSESWGVRAREDGSGKTVWFSLPVAPAPQPEAAPAAPGRAQAVPGPSVPEGPGERVPASPASTAAG